MPVLLIIKFVVSIIFYAFLLTFLVELIKVRMLNGKLKNLKDEKEKEAATKQIKRGKNIIKFMLFGIIFLLIISVFTSGYLK